MNTEQGDTCGTHHQTDHHTSSLLIHLWRAPGSRVQLPGAAPLQVLGHGGAGLVCALWEKQVFVQVLGSNNEPISTVNGSALQLPPKTAELSGLRQ